MNVLGISLAHDSSVALVKDGVLKHFLKEERLTRIKRDMMPYKSLFNMLYHNDSIDMVCITSPTPNTMQEHSFIRVVQKLLKCPIVSYGDDHHLTHASLAFYNSGFEECLVFVIDRNGSPINNCMRESETVFKAQYPCEFTPLHKNYWVHNSGSDYDPEVFRTKQLLDSNGIPYNADHNMSIVRVYESATTLIGQDPLENGKTMGLSSYGKDDPNFQKLFLNGYPVDSLFTNVDFLGKEMTTTLYKDHIAKFTKSVDKENYQEYANYAYQVQKQTQEAVLNLVSEWVEKTGIKNVCITGGYGMNVVANNYLVKNLNQCQFYFEPLCDDSGNSIGAALHAYRDKTKDMSVNKIKNTFVHGFNPQLKQVGTACTETDIVNYLIDQKTVAVFNGLAESGPRALGNRSILFDARNQNAKEIVNNIKKREWYRPFAAMVLEDKFDDYFDTLGLTESKFMCISFNCKTPEKIPGVVHVDNSCRVQTVNEEVRHINNVLEQFNSRTGCPVLLNTSFNMAGEPLIETQEEAIQCFNNSDIDVLWFPEISCCLVKP